MSIGKDGSLDTNLIDGLPPGQQQQLPQQPAAQPPPPPQPPRSQPSDDHKNNKISVLQPSYGGSGATAVQVATAVVTTGGGNTALTSPKRGDEAPEELVPAHGAFFFALGCGSALIVTLVGVTFALAYKRTNKSLLRSKSKESLQ